LTFRRASAKFEFVVQPLKELKSATEKFVDNNAEPTSLKVESQQTGLLQDIAARMGAVVSLVGMYGSYRLDAPTGATVVCTFGLALLLLASIRPLIVRKAAPTPEAVRS
jgi:hypothetical protein